MSLWRFFAPFFLVDRISQAFYNEDHIPMELCQIETGRIVPSRSMEAGDFMKKKAVAWLPYGVSPALTMVLLGLIYAGWGLFPFGKLTVSWCDMTQQVAPLLAQLQDVLLGKANLLFSMQNAGGMNFWGVFLFFLSSPFSFSVAFVDKADLLQWMNVLVAVKLTLSAFTAVLLLRKWLPRLDWPAVWSLSLLYAFGGFALLFYQNLMWLDVMALFPLLLLAFGRLCRGKPLAFVLALSAQMVLSFYLSYMVVLFLLLGFGAYLLWIVPQNRRGKQALLLGGACLVSACLTAPVWLPALLQYASSARTSDLLANVSARLFPNIYTTLPLLFCTALILGALPFVRFGDRGEGRREKCLFWLFLLMAFPLVLDPVNKMWHGGSYQAFPARYGYITTLLGLLLAGCVLQRFSQQHSPRAESSPGLLAAGIAALLVPLGLGACLLHFCREDLDAYVTSLWGDEGSFRWLLLFFLVAAAAYWLLLWMFRRSLLGRRVFAVLLCLLTVGNCLFQGSVYLGAAGRSDFSWRSLFSLEGQIDDSSFTRVKPASWDFDTNSIGAMGYNTFDHYTSLTPSTTLFTMKKLGYSSNWMEVTSQGGSLLTDALLSNRYAIAKNDASLDLWEPVCQKAGYQILESPFSLPLGVRVSGEISQWEALPEGSRFEIQQSLYEMLGGEGDLFTLYQPSQAENTSVWNGEDGLTHVTRVGEGTSRLVYQVEVSGWQALYFDAFRNLSTRLEEPINGSFSIKVNGETVTQSYPSKRENGLLYLGAFQNESVTVEVELLKDVSLRSFGLAGLDVELLRQTVEQAPGVDVQVDGRHFSAQTQAGEGEFLHVAIPYDRGFTARVNGKAVAVSQVNDGFLAIPLEEGENTIEISFLPAGMKLGAAAALLGAVLLWLLLLGARRGWLYRPWLQRGSLWVFGVAGAAAFGMLYLFPMAVYLLA